jgi:hypothetical protein
LNNNVFSRKRFWYTATGHNKPYHFTKSESTSLGQDGTPDAPKTHSLSTTSISRSCSMISSYSVTSSASANYTINDAGGCGRRRTPFRGEPISGRVTLLTFDYWGTQVRLCEAMAFGDHARVGRIDVKGPSRSLCATPQARATNQAQGRLYSWARRLGRFESCWRSSRYKGYADASHGKFIMNHVLFGLFGEQRSSMALRRQAEVPCDKYCRAALSLSRRSSSTK